MSGDQNTTQNNDTTQVTKHDSEDQGHEESHRSISSHFTQKKMDTITTEEGI